MSNLFLQETSRASLKSLAQRDQDSAEMLRRRGKTNICVTYKRQRARAGTAQCDVCGYFHNLAVHHIVPFCAGGSNDEENVLLLCPNHHAMAHSLRWTTDGVYSGPRTRDALVVELQACSADPDAYKKRKRRRPLTSAERHELVAAGVVTIVEAAQLLGCSTSDIRQLLKGGSVHFARVGRKMVVPRNALQDYAAALAATG